MKNIIHKISKIRIFLIYISIFFTLSTGNCFAEQKDKWSPAPLACLPSRAVEWTNLNEQEPCHCPSKNKCGGEFPTVNPEDLEFTVVTGFDWDGVSIWTKPITTTILGTEVPDIVSGKASINSILSATDTQVQHGQNFLRTLLKDVIIKKTGVNIATWDGNPATTSIQTKISLRLINQTSEKIAEWIKQSNMPLGLISQCCHALCPTGMYPEIIKTEKPANYVPYIFKKTELDDAIISMQGFNSEYEQLPTKDKDADILSGIEKITSDASSYVNTYLINVKNNGNNIDNNLDLNNLNNIFIKYTKYIKDNSSEFIPLTTNDAAEEYLEQVKTVSKALANEKYIRSLPLVTSISEIVECKQNVLVIREGCIREGTEITLADGTKQKIENLKVGDSVKTQKGTAKITAKSHFTQDTDYMYSINTGRAFFTVEHPILTTEGWKSVNPNVTSTKITHMKIKGALKVGDVLIREDGKNITVTSIDKVKLSDIPAAFNLSLSDKSNFYADGYLMKSFGQMQMHY